MEQTQYLEITSGRRNRNLNSLPGFFEVPLSQSGQKQAIQALDPVSLAASQLEWTSYAFNIRQGTGYPSQLIVTIEDITTSGSSTPSIGNATSPTTYIVNTTGTGASGSGALQIADDYYVGAVAAVGDGSTVATDRRRIINYTYLGYDRAEFTFDAIFSSAITAGTTNLYIVDPTNLNSSISPYFFIPMSPSVPNLYVNMVLFNETTYQSRPVKGFDKTTHLMSIVTSGSKTSTTSEGPITSWSETDLYSLRRQIPVLSIASLDGDVANNASTRRSFNLSVSDADNINDTSQIVGAFLEVKMPIDTSSTFLLAAGGTTQVTFAYSPSLDDQYYTGSSIRMITGACIGQISTISNYVGSTFVATLNPGFTTAASAADAYEIILLQQSKRIIKYVDYRSSAVGGSTTTVNFPITSSNGQPLYTNNYYDNLFINVPTRGGVRKISNYTVVTDSSGSVVSAIATIDSNGTNFSSAVVSGDAFTITSGLIEGGAGQFTYSISTQPAYILQFSYDNLFPFINAHAQISNASQWYEMELLNLILPNQILNCGFGGLITFYQYVYVQLANARSGANTSNNIISNNSSAVGMTFRATIDDVPNPVNSTFIKIDGDGMTQIVKFDPQDNLNFSVFLSNSSDPNQRDLFKVLPAEHYSPLPPNPLIQISAMFSLKKVILKQDVIASSR